MRQEPFSLEKYTLCESGGSPGKLVSMIIHTLYPAGQANQGKKG
jgi:hypothetical protein